MNRSKARQDLDRAIAKVKARAEYHDLEWLANVLEAYRAELMSEADRQRKEIGRNG